MKRSLLVFVLAITFGLCVGSAQADMVYNNFGYDTATGEYDLYNTTWSPQAVLGQDVSAGFATLMAMRFTVGSTSYTLSGVQIALGYPESAPGADHSLFVSLYAENAGLPGTLQETLGLVTATHAAGSVVSIDSTTHPLLAAGQTYWMAIAPGASNTAVDCYANGQLLTGTAAAMIGGKWETTDHLGLPALKVNGSPVTPAVPEPGSVLLALIGGVPAIGFALRRRK